LDSTSMEPHVPGLGMWLKLNEIYSPNIHHICTCSFERQK
ncbi:mCG1030032, partial [Mus musculus]